MNDASMAINSDDAGAATVSERLTKSQLESTTETGVKLKKELGLMEGVSIIVGIIIGSGIFISPKGVLMSAGSVGLSLVIWVLCGVLSALGAICYAELGTMIPKSGGDYTYIQEAFGAMPAFLYLWVASIVFVPCTNAIGALTFANYILQPLYDSCMPPEAAVKHLAASVICLLTFINCYNVKVTTKLQDGFMFFKIIALMFIILTGLVFLGMGRTENFDNAFHGTVTDPSRIALAFYSGIFSYTGWNYLNFVTEELKNPHVNLPRAIGISMPIITIIYFLSNVGYFVLLSPYQMLSSSAVAVTFGDKLPYYLRWVMPLCVAGSTLGGLSVHIFTSSRICFVGARLGQLPDAFATININTFTPVPSLIFLGVLSLFMLRSGDIYTLINYSSFVESFFIAISVAGLLYLRITRPNVHRPVKVPLFFPVTYLLICAFLLSLPVYASPIEVGMGILIILSGVPIYYLFIYWKNKPTLFHKATKQFTLFIQKMFMAIRQEIDDD